MSLDEKVRASSNQKKSKIVLALDLEGKEPKQLASRSEAFLERLANYVCAVKINRQLVMSLGWGGGGVESIVKLAHDLGLPCIMDAKLNDVGHTNEFIARSYFDLGFDGIIASPVAGWEGGLDSVFAEANRRGRGVLLLVYMSNPGAEAYYSMAVTHGREKPKPIFELLAETAVKWKAQGVVVGATRPEIISRVRQLIGPDLAIYSPGVGVQGGDAKKALNSGSTYLIVGRAIYGARDPVEAATSLRDSVS